MNTCFRMYYFLFTTSRHIGSLELLQIAFGNGKNGARENRLYFAAGINDEADGLFGDIRVV